MREKERKNNMKPLIKELREAIKFNRKMQEGNKPFSEYDSFTLYKGKIQGIEYALNTILFHIKVGNIIEK